MEQLHNTKVGDGELIEVGNNSLKPKRARGMCGELRTLRRCFGKYQATTLGSVRMRGRVVRRTIFLDELKLPRSEKPESEDKEVFMTGLPIKEGCSKF